MTQTRRRKIKARGRSKRIASQQKDTVMREVRSAPTAKAIQKNQASTKKKKIIKKS